MCSGRDIGSERSPSARELGHGNVSYLAPSAGIYVKIGRQDLVHRAPEFTEASISEEGHQGMLEGAAALAMTAVDIMTRPDLRIRIREQWEKEMASRR